MAVAGSPSVRANAMVGHSGGSHTVQEEDENHPMKWLCIGMGTLIVLILGLNFLSRESTAADEIRADGL